MKNLLFVLLLLPLLAFSQGNPYGARFFQTDVITLAPSADTTFTLTNAWYNVAVYTTDETVNAKFGDATTVLANENEIPMFSGFSISFGEKTQLKKVYLENTSATDTVKVYFVGDKSVVKGS